MTKLLPTMTAVVTLVFAGTVHGQPTPPEIEQTGPVPTPDADERPALTVGDPAPAIQVSSWVKGEPLDRFEAGRVYVVEFWATWCGPCKASIPKLTALQKQWGDRVTIVGVDIWENAKNVGRDSSFLPRVQKFVEERGDEMVYRVAFGGEIARMGETWVQAAGRDGIPSAFIVDQKSRVVWIGNPLLPDDHFDDTLAAVIEGRYTDHAMNAQQRASLDKWRWIRMTRKLESDFRKARAWGKPEQISETVDRMVAFDPPRARQAAVFKFETLMLHAGPTDAFAYARSITDGPYKDDAAVLNGLVWSVVKDPKAVPAQCDWALLIDLASRADRLGGGVNPAAIDTLARVHFAKGDIDAAIATQRRAVDAAPGDAKAVMQKTLDEYLAAKN